MAFVKATKSRARLRLGLVGPSGSGKTFTALMLAKHMGGRVAVIDTERGSASKYASLFEFDTSEPDEFSPDSYIRTIHEAEAAGYDILIIDSLSHAWMGKGGALEMVDNAAKRSQSGNSFAAWREVTPRHNALVDAILRCNCHVIATLRAKTEYVLEKDERTGKTTPRKVGMAPVQRDGLEYEFDVVADMDLENTLIVSKSRCSELSGKVIPKPGAELAGILKAWLSDGTPAPAVAPEKPKPALQHAPERQPTPRTAPDGIAMASESARIQAAELKAQADAAPAKGTTGLVDDLMVNTIKSLGTKLGYSAEALMTKIAADYDGKGIKGLTKAEASSLLDRLQVAVDSKSAKGAAREAKPSGFGG